jgi:hypothetical protein
LVATLLEVGAPAWYRRWAALDSQFLLEADWARQAVPH